MEFKYLKYFLPCSPKYFQWRLGFSVAEDAPLSGRSFRQLKQKFKLYHCLPVFYINEFPKKGFLVKKRFSLPSPLRLRKLTT